MKWIHQLADVKVRQRLRYFYLIVLLLLCIAMIGSNVRVGENKEYTDFDHVALYILTYNDVPENYVPKSEGAPPGTNSISVYDVYDNTLDPVKLPTGYTYTEVYINAVIGDVGAERFVFSDDGTLYYTLNHYESFSEITKSKILGGYYMFRGIFISILFGGLVSVGFLVVLEKEVTVNDLKKDILLDYNLLKDRVELVRDKTKEYHRKRKVKRLSKKEE